MGSAGGVRGGRGECREPRAGSRCRDTGAAPAAFAYRHRQPRPMAHLRKRICKRKRPASTGPQLRFWASSMRNFPSEACQRENTPTCLVFPCICLPYAVNQTQSRIHADSNNSSNEVAHRQADRCVTSLIRCAAWAPSLSDVLPANCDSSPSVDLRS